MQPQHLHSSYLCLPGGRAQGHWGRRSTSQVGGLRGAGGAPSRWADSRGLGSTSRVGRLWGSTFWVGGLKGAGGAPPRWVGSRALESTFQVGKLKGAGGAPPGRAGSGALGVGEEEALQAEVPKHQAATPPSLQEGGRYSQSHTAVHLGALSLFKAPSNWWRVTGKPTCWAVLLED